MRQVIRLCLGGEVGSRQVGTGVRVKVYRSLEHVGKGMKTCFCVLL